MLWNWQLPNWPNFSYYPDQIVQKEREFLLGSGSAFAFLRNISTKERNEYVVEILSIEGLESSKIEGEILERESLQSSIKRHFGLDGKKKKGSNNEAGMAELLCDVYETYDEPLTYEMLSRWHELLFKESRHLDDVGKFRTHPEPMQIVSGRLNNPRIFFEAPPSKNLDHEMTRFIDWFNKSRSSDSILGRAAIAHIYFESIHPFEDGNGRIGRILSEKALSQGIGQPTLIAISKLIEINKKAYYAELSHCNHSLDATQWVDFFSGIVLQAQNQSMRLLNFLINKSKMLTALSGQINERQEKALLRMFQEGVDGFAGGLSAENYIAITKASRATATRDLIDLVEKGALIKSGTLRHTRYWLLNQQT